MKKNLLFLAACSLFLTCHQKQELEIPDEPEEPLEYPYIIPCGCVDEWFQEETDCDRELPWDYPIKPNTEEWAQLQTHDEVLAICQIPDDVLSLLSTEDLTVICLKFPGLGAELCTPFDRGLDSLTKNFNGVRELLQREDASKGLLKWYRCAIPNFSYIQDSDLPNVEKGFFAWYIIATELLLSRCQSPDETGYIEIVQHLVCGSNKLFSHPEYSTYSYMANCFARFKIMYKTDESIIEEIPYGFDNHFFTMGSYYGDWEDTRPSFEQAMIAINSLSCHFIN